MSDPRKVGLHENLNRELQHKGPSDRAFGLTFFVFFALVALVPLVRHRPPRLWALLLSGVFVLASIAFPKMLSPLNLIWARIGLLLSRFTNPIMTGLMFYLFFVPTSLILRCLGKDPLRLKFDHQTASYWLPRVPSGPDPESMRNQF
jgi:hypothetical protein